MSATEEFEGVTAIRWIGDASTGTLELLDQRKLPDEELWLPIHTADAAADAIRDMVVRGAPAIGLAAAYGVVLAAQELGNNVRLESLQSSLDTLRASRPTAVNLGWAIDRMQNALEGAGQACITRLFKEAQSICTEDIDANHRIGRYGAKILPQNVRILTHCNTGALATAGYGTALGVVRSAFANEKLTQVYATETRPYLQGARLTMWELMQDGIPATLITDGMAAYLMQDKEVDAVIIGADRIAANGDTANKIGSYALAVLAQFHDIPLYVAAPTSTVDLHTATGAEIPIEMRSEGEVVSMGGTRIAPRGARALHPAFDITPSALITAIITENGVVRAPYPMGLQRVMA